MPYTLKTYNCLENKMYSIMYSSSLGRDMRKSNEPLVNALFLVKWANELFFEFAGHMKAKFKKYKIKIGLKENAKRIA